LNLRPFDHESNAQPMQPPRQPVIYRHPGWTAILPSPKVTRCLMLPLLSIFLQPSPDCHLGWFAPYVPPLYDAECSPVQFSPFTFVVIIVNFHQFFNRVLLDEYWTFNSTLSQTKARPRQARGQICTISALKMSNKNTTYLALIRSHFTRTINGIAVILLHEVTGELPNCFQLIWLLTDLSLTPLSYSCSPI